MLMPSIFGENLLDDFFGFPFDGDYNYNASGLMTTDVKDTDHGYEVTMNMPGVKKEDVKAELKDGYLTVSAVSNKSTDERTRRASTSDVNVTAVHAAEASMLVKVLNRKTSRLSSRMAP